MCYYQSPNRLRSDSLPCEQPHCPGRGGIRFHRLGCPHVLCCVGAVNRIVPNYIIHMWMATADRGLAAALYGPCTVSAIAGPGVPVKLACTTAYPFEETIRVSVEPAAQGVLPACTSAFPPGAPSRASRSIALPWTPLPDQNGFLRIVAGVVPGRPGRAAVPHADPGGAGL